MNNPVRGRGSDDHAILERFRIARADPPVGLRRRVLNEVARCLAEEMDTIAPLQPAKRPTADLLGGLFVATGLAVTALSVAITLPLNGLLRSTPMDADVFDRRAISAGVQQDAFAVSTAPVPAGSRSPAMRRLPSIDDTFKGDL